MMIPRRAAVMPILLAVGVTIGAVTLGSTVPAAADPPETTSLQRTVTLTFTDVCDFSFQVQWDVNGRITRFLDQDGDLTKRVVTLVETNAVFTNLDTGKTVEERVLGAFRQMTPDDPPFSEVTVAGLFFHLTLPGEGAVVLDAGRFTRDLVTGEVIFEAGPKPFVAESWAVLCPVLS
jgi:hypothetical protein